MAQVKFYRGNISAYKNEYKEGIYFSMDEKVIYHNGVKFGGIDPQYFSGVTKDFDIEGNIVRFKKLNQQGTWDDVTINLVKAADNSIEIGTITNNEGTVNDGFSVKVKANYATDGEDGLKLGTDGLYVDLTKKTEAIAANKAAIDTNKANIEKLNGADNVDGSVSNKIKVAIEGLDVNPIGGGGKVITTISQSDGKVSATAIDLAASSVAFTASNKSFNADNVKDALDTLYAQSGEGSKVTLESAEGTEGILKVYTIKQGVREVGKINIPKDLVVKSGSVVKGNWNDGVFTENASGSGTALKLIIANKEETPIYINTLDLVKDHTAGNGIAISDTNVISVQIAEGSENFLTVDEYGVKLSGVQAAIDAASGQVNSIINDRLGAGVTSSSTATDQFTELNNKLGTGISTAEGKTVTAQLQALSGSSTNDTSDTISVIGAKKYTDAKIEALDLPQVGGTDKVITTISQADGKVSAKAIDLTASNVKATESTGVPTAVDVTGETVSEQIASLATSIKSASTAAAAAHTEVEAKTDGHVRVSVAKSSDNTHDVVTITENDIASANALTAEIDARKAIDGIDGNTYSANKEATYISGATSLNDADVKLNNQLKIVSDALEWIDCGEYTKPKN